MSHFTVLVVGDDAEEQLAAFHEFECTGDDNEFVQDIDQTEEKRAEYERETTQRMQAADGTLYHTSDDQFYRDPTPAEAKTVGMGTGWGNGLSWTSKDWKDGKGYRAKVAYVPEGFKEVEVKVKDIMTFLEYISDYEGKEVLKTGQRRTEKHKYGYVLVDKNNEVVKVIDRTNPNAKWDWYVLGGRWSGFFKLKKGKRGELGEPGTFDNVAPNGHVDTASVEDIDFEGMRNDAALEAKEKYERLERLCGGTIPKLEYRWADMIDDNGRFKDLKIDEKRTLYHSQKAKEVVNEAKAKSYNKEDQDFLTWIDLESYQCSKEEFVLRARNRAISTHAILMKGEWMQQGEMGWFGCSSDEMSQEEWEKRYAELIDSLPKGTKISVYDCHI